MAHPFVKRHPRLVIFVSLALALTLAWVVSDWLGQSRTERRYQALIQEVDRLDPTWREGISATSLDPIPDEDNSALLVDATVEKIPRGWSALKGQWPPLVLDPAKPIPAELVAELRLRRDEAKGALTAARALANHPRGRFPRSTLEVPRAVPQSRQTVETVSGLLYLDALIRIEEMDMEGAATDIRAMICTGRSIDLDPSLATQVGRVNCVLPAVATIERLLAHGQLPGLVLASLQKLLEDEATHPLALTSLRGDRAAQEKLNEQVRAGEMGISALFDSTPSGTPPLFLYSWRTLRENQSRLLEVNTRLVEIAKMAAEQQGPAFRLYQDKQMQEWNDRDILGRLYTFPFRDLFMSSLAAGAWQSRHRVNLNLAILALASERFRLDHGRWPDASAELVPAYLSSVPYDPYSGGPLHWKRDEHGLIIYSVGLDGKDDGGVWPRGNPYSYNKDEGFRLDDPERRDIASSSKP
jgi:hypothetical protein